MAKLLFRIVKNADLRVNDCNREAALWHVVTVECPKRAAIAGHLFRACASRRHFQCRVWAPSSLVLRTTIGRRSLDA